MKKLLLTMFVAMMTITSQAAITVYVQAEEAPHIWAWGAAGNIFSEKWPGPVLTEKKTLKNNVTQEDTEFWYYTFDESLTQVNILFNNGGNELGQDIKQTGDIKGITTDRYFTYDGESAYTDITEQFGGEIPDVEVTSLLLVGNNNNWGNTDPEFTGSTEPIPFTVETQGLTFKGSLTIDLTGVEVEDNLWTFKLRPNGLGWVGITQVTMPENTPEWCKEAVSQGNFEIDLEDPAVVANGPKFKFTAEWAGGKDSDWGWTVSVALAGGDTPGLPGDVNNDGSVDVADISAIISVMAGSATYDAADVNGDSSVDVADISSVISIMAGGK